MKRIIERIRTALVLSLLCLLGASTAWAATEKTNPVTGETESYENVFNGSGSSANEWNSADNWDPSTTPFITGTYSPALVSGKTVSTSTAIDGWTLRVGAYDNANITWSGGITKIQASSYGCWLTADETSSINIASFGGNQLEGSDSAPFKLSSAKAGGITWSAGLTSASNTSLPFWYYLKGEGTVVYVGDITIANAQVIKQADISLTGTSQVSKKTLVTFGTGTTKTFTASADIKVKSSDTVVKTIYVGSVRSSGSAIDNTTSDLTTSDAVGTCEIVQCTDGIVLFYVDGSAPTPTVYKPSISINFTNGNGLTTAADVGLEEYAVPGTSWNNFTVGNNTTFSTVNSVNSSGAASTEAGVSVTISGTRGSHSCSGLTAASNPLHGYIDENANNATPTVTVAGIPYYKYRVIVYHSTDNANVPFSYDTINGTNYTYVENALAEGSTAWGNSGAQNSANAILEGGNTLVTGELSGSTLTVVGHRGGGANNARGCIAAIQIIEVKAEIGENDFEIPVSGDTTYTVSEAKTLSGTVYLTGNGTLTLAGSAKITAATINVGSSVTLNINADRLDATTFTGGGTVVYNGAQPSTTKGFNNSSAWTGTVWVKNVGDTSRGEATNSKVSTCLGSDTTDASSNDLNKWGNSNSFVKFTNVRGYMATANVPWTLILDDDSSNYAWYNNDGWTARTITIAGLKGNGTFWDINDGGCRPFLNFTDASQFTGSIKALGKQVFLNGAGSGKASDLLSGRIIIPANQTLTVAANKTWHTRNGLVVNGILNVNGTLASESTTSAVSGTGTVVFDGKAPSPVDGENETKWWKNSDWDGIVQIKNISNMVGLSTFSGTYLDFASYGNESSKIEISNITGWLPNQTFAGELILAGNLTINNAVSGYVFKVGKLSGSGGISSQTANNSATTTFQAEDASRFSGWLGIQYKRVVFGSSLPTGEFVHGQLYVSEGAVVTNQYNAESAWWATGGIKVDGELCSPNLTRFGGGTNITTGDNGTFTLTSTGNGTEGETDTDYTRIQGTGSLKYSGTGWRALSTNNFPTAMTLVNEQAGDILLSRALTYTIGSLAGSKNFQGNYGSGSRFLKVIQSKNTEWSGKVVSDGYSRLAGITIDSSSTGTLTYSGTGALSVPLTINGGAVKVSGTWKGATTVGGTLALEGAGKIDGAVTTSDGSVLDYSGATGDTHITGTLTIASGTTIKFPSGTSFPYKVAESVESSLTGDVTFYVGGTQHTGTLVFDSGYAYPVAKATFAGGESGTWSGLTWDVTYTGTTYNDCAVTVSESGTIQLSSAVYVANKMTFNVPSGKTLTLTGSIYAKEINFIGDGTVICSAAGTLSGKITGNAVIQYPEGVLPATGTTWTDSAWTGTLVIVNCGHLNVGGTARVPFETLGNANSKIKAPGFKGYAAVLDQNTICQAELIIDASTTFEFNHGWLDTQWKDTEQKGFYTEDQNAGFKFRKLSGAGKLRLDGDTDFAQYVFCDVSDFTGDVDITYPEGGGRKSYLFGVPATWEIVGSAYPANLVVASNMTVNAGKLWDVPAGIILDNNSTLTLADGAIITALSPKSDGKLSIPSGTATLSNVLSSVMTTSLDIGNGATFKIADTGLSSITIPADSSEGGTYSNSGVLDLRDCTALETLHLALGESTKFDDINTAKLLLPATCTNFVYDIGSKRDLDGYTLPTVDDGTNTYYYATETIQEYASGGFEVTNVVAGAEVWLIRQNGALIHTAVEGTGRTYKGGRSFAGAACWHEWDFEQTAIADKLKDSGACTTNNSVVATNNLSITSASATYQTITVSGQEPKMALPSYFLPHPTDLLTFPADAIGWSMALRCSMPTGDGKKVAIAFGDTDNGILGLASAQDGFVEMFNWVNGTYTTLAQLKVEMPTEPQYNNMHLFVFTVTNNTVTLYRDGEFIHSATFSLKDGGAITQFKVGDVCGTRPANDNLPAAITSETTGYVDYIRLYDRVLPEADITGLSLRRPFVSAIDSYERTIGAYEVTQWSTTTGAWTLKPGNNGTQTTANAPAASANVTLSSDEKASISLNLTDDVKYGTLVFNGEGEISLLQASSGKIGADMFVVRKGMDLIVDYNAVNLANAIAGVDQGAMLTFDFTEFPFGGVAETTNIVLVGNVPAKEYDSTCGNRFAVTTPSPMPAHIQSVTTEWVELEGDVWSYKVTITPDHAAGSDVYYKSGYWSSIESSFIVTNSSGRTTNVLPGDTVVIPEYISGDNGARAFFDSALPANITAIRVEKDYKFESGVDNAAILGGVTVTVAESKTLTFGAQYHDLELGAVTFNGQGSVNFDVDASAASIAGTAPVAVASDKTLTLGSIATFVTGGVTGTGTVKLPAIDGAVALNTYGNANSVVALTGLANGSLVDAAVSPTVRLDGDATITTYADSTAYSFAKLTGTRDLTFAAGSPTSLTIQNIEGFSGSLNNNSSTEVTVSKITLPESVDAGTLLLATNGTGEVTVSAVYIGNAAEATGWPLAYAAGGVYRAAAQVGSTYYPTLASALAAANGSAVTLVADSVESATVAYGDSINLTIASGVTYAGQVTAADGTTVEPAESVYSYTCPAYFDSGVEIPLGKDVAGVATRKSYFAPSAATITLDNTYGKVDGTYYVVGTQKSSETFPAFTLTLNNREKANYVLSFKTGIKNNNASATVTVTGQNEYSATKPISLTGTDWNATDEHLVELVQLPEGTVTISIECTATDNSDNYCGNFGHFKLTSVAAIESPVAAGELMIQDLLDEGKLTYTSSNFSVDTGNSNEGKAIGSTKSDTTFTFVLYFPEAGKYGFSYLSGNSGSSSTVNWALTKYDGTAVWSTTTPDSITDDTNWHCTQSHSHTFGDSIAAGLYKLKFSVASITGTYAGNFGYFAFTGGPVTIDSPTMWSTELADASSVTIVEGGSIILDVHDYATAGDWIEVGGSKEKTFTLSNVTGMTMANVSATTLSSEAYAATSVSSNTVTVTVMSLEGITTTTWTGAAQDGLWGTAANWTYGVPTELMTAEFTSDATVTLGETRAVTNLVLNGSTLTLVGNQLNVREFAADATGTIALSGATLAGNGKDGDRQDITIPSTMTIRVLAGSKSYIQDNYGVVTVNGPLVFEDGSQLQTKYTVHLLGGASGYGALDDGSGSGKRWFAGDWSQFTGSYTGTSDTTVFIGDFDGANADWTINKGLDIGTGASDAGIVKLGSLTMNSEAAYEIKTYADSTIEVGGGAINSYVSKSGTGTLTIKHTGTETMTYSTGSGFTATIVVPAGKGKVVIPTTSNVIAGEGTDRATNGDNYEFTYTIVRDVDFEYYSSYTNAVVTATVAASGTYKLKFGDTEVASATAESAGTITFNNVNVSSTALGDTISWTVTDGANSQSGSAIKGTTTGTGWMAWSESGDKVGTWKNENDADATPTYTDSYATFTGTNIYNAVGSSTGEVVTVNTSVKFRGAADEDLTIDTDAQAAVRIGEGNVFQVYQASIPSWLSVYNDTLGVPDGDDEYAVTIKLDYTKQKYGVTVNNIYALTNNAGEAEFALARAASQMQKVSYLGSGSFKSLSGSYISTGYIADIGTDGSVTNIVVSNEFVTKYMGDVLAKDISDFLSPNNKTTAMMANGLNYFENYALGLDPTDEDDKPTIKVETDDEGKFVVTLVDGDGNQIEGASNVALTLKFETGDNPNNMKTETTSSFSGGTATINPTEISRNVMYYRVKVDIGAK